LPIEQFGGAGVGVGVAADVGVAVGAGVGVLVGVGDGVGEGVGDAVGDGVGVLGLRCTLAPGKLPEDSNAKTVSDAVKEATALATQL